MIILRQKAYAIQAEHDYNFMQEIKNGLSKTNRFLPKSTAGKVAVLGTAGLGGAIGIASELGKNKTKQ